MYSYAKNEVSMSIHSKVIDQTDRQIHTTKTLPHTREVIKAGTDLLSALCVGHDPDTDLAHGWAENWTHIGKLI